MKEGGEIVMYWLRLYELMELSHDHQKAFAYFDDPSYVYTIGNVLFIF